MRSLVKDRIIQIAVDSDPQGYIFGLSENGNLYRWEHVKWIIQGSSPEIETSSPRNDFLPNPAIKRT